jgi:hypothetical protein
MNGPCRLKLDDYIDSYNKHQDYAPIDSNIFKDALREEIGSDELALQAYTLFHEDKYQEMLEHWLQNHSAMTPANATRFKELLIWLTSIIATKDDFSWRKKWEDWKNPWKEKILQVVGDRSAVTKDMFHYLRFCYELMFAKLVDIGGGADNFHECHFCNSIAFYWRKNPLECISTGDVVGEVEWDEEYCYPSHIWHGLRGD